MKALLAMAARLARSRIPVLLQGETGVGKELLARRIHEDGPRRDGPLVVVNCGAIPQQLVESMLFGHERGAFTGAVEQRRGVFEAADGGTLVLDEVGELTLAAQVALLRVLETKRIMRVGSFTETEVDVRVVAATNRDLEAMCEAGTFRVDLLHRLNAVTLRVPPLRARRGEIAALAQEFLRRATEADGGTRRSLSPDALAALEAHVWPGNIRELKNAIEYAAALTQHGAIMACDLPERVRGAAPRPSAPAGSASAPTARGSLKAGLWRLEAEMLVQALREAGWNQVSAAKRLDLPLRTLQHKLKAHGIRRLGYAL